MTLDGSCCSQLALLHPTMRRLTRLWKQTIALLMNCKPFISAHKHLRLNNSSSKAEDVSAYTLSCLGDENRGYWATFSPAFCGPFIHLLWAWGMMPSSTPSCLPQRHYRELMKRGSRACSPSSKPRSWDRR